LEIFVDAARDILGATDYGFDEFERRRSARVVGVILALDVVEFFEVLLFEIG
jgi:hypothetical protein